MNRPRRQDGQALVGVIVLIALLFFAATAMTLAVSQNLQAIRMAGSRNAQQYSAESAADRGLALALGSGRFVPQSGGGTSQCQLWEPARSVNGVSASGDVCVFVVRGGATMVAARQVGPQALASPGCLPLPVDNPNGTWKAVWFTLSGFGSVKPVVGVDDNPGCASAQKETCQIGSPGVTYLFVGCATKAKQLFLSLKQPLADIVRIGAFVVRQADGAPDLVVRQDQEGKQVGEDSLPVDCVLTSVGTASTSVAESDVYVNGCVVDGGSPTVTLRHGLN